MPNHLWTEEFKIKLLGQHYPHNVCTNTEFKKEVVDAEPENIDFRIELHGSSPDPFICG
jgi:hypothetical protein